MRLVTLAAALLGVTFAHNALADEVIRRASAEMAGYTDSVGVSVLTPSVAATVENQVDGWAINGRYLLDFVSAASPDIVATASPRWSEIRQGGNLGARYKPGWFGVAGGGNISYSNDYLAAGGNIQFTQDLDEKLWTLVEGYSYGHDTIGRTDTPFKTFSRELTTHGTSVGISRIVNTGLVLGVYGDAIFELGDQSKPYRYVPMFLPDVAPKIPRGVTAFSAADFRETAKPIEQLPLGRDRFAVTGKLGWRVEKMTMRLDERLYDDTWSMLATTTDFRWFFDVGDRMTVWPHMRVHIQSGTDFWKRVYVATSIHDIPEYRTGDRELGPLSNFGAGGGIRFALGHTGAKEDFVLQFTGDGTWTTFTNALYVKNRFSALVTSSVEMAF
jgi:hypothetical protein